MEICDVSMVFGKAQGGGQVSDITQSDNIFAANRDGKAIDCGGKLTEDHMQTEDKKMAKTAEEVAREIRIALENMDISFLGKCESSEREILQALTAYARAEYERGFHDGMEAE